LSLREEAKRIRDPSLRSGQAPQSRRLTRLPHSPNGSLAMTKTKKQLKLLLL